MSVRVGNIPILGVSTSTGRSKVYASNSEAWPVSNRGLPFSFENVTAYNQPVPAGATGCWVTLIGAGGGGGGARSGATSTVRRGGGGGGGGAKIFRVFIPVASLTGPWSVQRGYGGIGGWGFFGTGNGSAGEPGTPSTFTCGSITLQANGGGAGTAGTATVDGAGGAGGTASVTGMTASSDDGAVGGSASGWGLENYDGGAGGGGAGGYIGSNNVKSVGGKGGVISATVDTAGLGRGGRWRRHYGQGSGRHRQRTRNGRSRWWRWWPCQCYHRISPEAGVPATAEAAVVHPVAMAPAPSSTVATAETGIASSSGSNHDDPMLLWRRALRTRVVQSLLQAG